MIETQMSPDRRSRPRHRAVRCGQRRTRAAAKCCLARSSSEADVVIPSSAQRRRMQEIFEVLETAAEARVAGVARPLEIDRGEMRDA